MSHPMNKAIFIFGTAVVGVIAASLVVWNETRNDSAPQNTPSGASGGNQAARSPTAGSSSPAAREGSRCEFKSGTRGAWSVAVDNVVTLDGRAIGIAGAATLPTQRTAFRGELQVEVLEADVLGAVLLAKWEHVDEAKKRASGIDEPFLLKVDAQCAVRDAARLRTTGIWSARAQQAAVAELWFSLPGAEGGAVVGRNGTGSFDAQVAWSDDGRLQRRLVGFRELWAPERGASMLEVVESRLTVRLDTGVWFASIDGDQELRGTGLPSARTTVSATPIDVRPDVFASASRQRGDYVWGELLSLAEPPRDVRPEVVFSDADRAAHQELQSVSFDAALDRFAAKLEVTDNIDQQWKDLSLFLEAKPTQIPRLAKTLKHQALPAKAAEAAFLAMGKARVPEARDALRTFVQDRSASPVDRWRASIALAGRADVTRVHVVELTTLAEQSRTSTDAPARFFGRNALLAASMMAGLSRDTEMIGEARRAIGGWLQSGDVSEVQLAFEAIGNLGDTDDLPLIEQWSQRPEVDLRAVVPQGIRRMPLRVVRDFELAWLRRETAPDVKQALWHLLDRQLTDEQQTLAEPFVTEAVKDLRAQHPVLTRQTLIKLLSPIASSNTEARAALLAQVPIEMESRSGLYSSLAEVLPARQVAAALAGAPIPEDTSPTEPTGPTPVPVSVPLEIKPGVTR